MKQGTKKKPIFYQVRATRDAARTQLREDSLRNQCYLTVKQYGTRGLHVEQIEGAFKRPMRTTIHKLIESGHLEAIYPKS